MITSKTLWAGIGGPVAGLIRISVGNPSLNTTESSPRKSILSSSIFSFPSIHLIMSERFWERFMIKQDERWSITSQKTYSITQKSNPDWIKVVPCGNQTSQISSHLQPFWWWNSIALHLHSNWDRCYFLDVCKLQPRGHTHNNPCLSL